MNRFKIPRNPFAKLRATKQQMTVKHVSKKIYSRKKKHKGELNE